MRGPSPEDDSHDGGFASSAGLARAVVDGVPELEAAGLAVGVAVVAEGAAAVVDRFVEDAFDRAVEGSDLFGVELVGGELGMQGSGGERPEGMKTTERARLPPGRSSIAAVKGNDWGRLEMPTTSLLPHPRACFSTATLLPKNSATSGRTPLRSRGASEAPASARPSWVSSLPFCDCWFLWP